MNLQQILTANYVVDCHSQGTKEDKNLLSEWGRQEGFTGKKGMLKYNEGGWLSG